MDTGYTQRPVHHPLAAPWPLGRTRAGLDVLSLSNHALEFVVIAWLSDIIRSDQPLEQRAKGQRWLVESGFLPAVYDGHLAYAVSV